MPCKVSSPFNPDLASAFLEAEILPTSGCMTNATSRKSGAEIHVINYQGSKEQNVELLLNDFEKKGWFFVNLIKFKKLIRPYPLKLTLIKLYYLKWMLIFQSE
jgi:hypothetical protein